MSMREGFRAVKEKMTEILAEIWRSLSSMLFQILCTNIPCEDTAVRVSKEGYIKYYVVY